MWALETNRRIFLDLFGKESSKTVSKAFLISSDFLIKDFKNELLLLWDTKPDKGNLPVAIIVQDNVKREFISWATTAIGGYRPFTAFFRVIEKMYAPIVFRSNEPALGKAENSLIGLIIGEALTQSSNILAVQDLSLLPCKSTYSFSLARAYALGYYSDSVEHGFITKNWKSARQLTNQIERKLSDEFILMAFRLILELDKKPFADKLNLPEVIVDICNELFSNGTIKRSWRLLEKLNPLFNEISVVMEGPRERRVHAFDMAIIKLNVFDPLISSFLAGLLASQIGPGTFDHLGMLTPYISKYPMALLWYGLCVGLHNETEVQESAGCLGRRLVRDLLAVDPLVSSPKYDISVGELEVCLDREVPIDFRVASQNHISVEIVPGVPAIMRWSAKRASSYDEEQVHYNTHFKHLSSNTIKQSPIFSDLYGKDLWKQGEAAILDLNSALERIKTTFYELEKQRSKLTNIDQVKRQQKNKH